MAVLRQARTGFKPISISAQLGKKRLDSLQIARAREEAKRKMNQLTFMGNGKRPLVKTVVEQKVEQLRKKLDAKSIPYYDAMLEEVRKNPNLPVVEISSIVVRGLRQANPTGGHMTTKVETLFKLAKKEGVIEVK